MIRPKIKITQTPDGAIHFFIRTSVSKPDNKHPFLRKMIDGVCSVLRKKYKPILKHIGIRPGEDNPTHYGKSPDPGNLLRIEPKDLLLSANPARVYQAVAQIVIYHAISLKWKKEKETSDYLRGIWSRASSSVVKSSPLLDWLPLHTMTGNAWELQAGMVMEHVESLLRENSNRRLKDYEAFYLLLGLYSVATGLGRLQQDTGNLNKTLLHWCGALTQRMLKSDMAYRISMIEGNISLNLEYLVGFITLRPKKELPSNYKNFFRSWLLRRYTCPSFGSWQCWPNVGMRPFFGALIVVFTFFFGLLADSQPWGVLLNDWTALTDSWELSLIFLGGGVCMGCLTGIFEIKERVSGRLRLLRRVALMSIVLFLSALAASCIGWLFVWILGYYHISPALSQRLDLYWDFTWNAIDIPIVAKGLISSTGISMLGSILGQLLWEDKAFIEQLSNPD